MAVYLGSILARHVLNMHRAVGKLFSGTLRVRGTGDAMTSVAWDAYYLEPISERSALGGGGVQPMTAMLHLYESAGETTTPRPDDLFWEQGVSSDSSAWLINSVTHRLNGDSGRAIFDCQVSRVGGA